MQLLEKDGQWITNDEIRYCVTSFQGSARVGAPPRWSKSFDHADQEGQVVFFLILLQIIMVGKVAPQTRTTLPSSRVNLWSGTKMAPRMRGVLPPQGIMMSITNRLRTWWGTGMQMILVSSQCRAWILKHCNPISNQSRTVTHCDWACFGLML